MKPKKKFAKVKSKRSKMPKFYPIDDQMKELSAMLEKEISDWPGVSRRPMFGYQGLYRDGQIFAALPRSRAMKSPTSIMIKFASASPPVLESVKKEPPPQRLIGFSLLFWSGTTGVPCGGERIVEARYHAQ